MRHAPKWSARIPPPSRPTVARLDEVTAYVVYFASRPDADVYSGAWKYGVNQLSMTSAAPAARKAYGGSRHGLSRSAQGGESWAAAGPSSIPSLAPSVSR
jgi:hypothetical protein